ncbi:expressed unknown protein [Seminavis robusta]|uniref:Uncharacterized protein n=1 Tax=Seminavis robusta TaxID=568900 RepID=A0A9N8EVC6_9STRA|nr:expressed unknown protein [Seminavis robusta]|eukprot:Sro2107_g314840.1 n/a (381) ;mRNA; f:6240-7531
MIFNTKSIFALAVLAKVASAGFFYPDTLEALQNHRELPSCAVGCTGCFSCENGVTDNGDGSLSVRVTHCKSGGTVSWMCCVGIDGTETGCDVTAPCRPDDGTGKCNGIPAGPSGGLVINIPDNAKTFTINTHDGQTSGNGDMNNNRCGGNGNQGKKGCSNSYSAHCDLEFSLATDYPVTNAPPPPTSGTPSTGENPWLGLTLYEVLSQGIPMPDCGDLGQEESFQGNDLTNDKGECYRVNICHGNAGQHGWNGQTVSRDSLDPTKVNGHAGANHNDPSKNKNPDYFPGAKAVPNPNGAGANSGSLDGQCGFTCDASDEFTCADGTVVKRALPDCEFADCPTPDTDPTPTESARVNGDPHFQVRFNVPPWLNRSGLVLFQF